MIRVAICDDNLNIANSIENVVMDMDIKGLSCDVFSSGVELIKHLQSDQISYNIYLMDIELPLQNGISTASIIRKNDKNALIIFITDYKDYVYEVFEVLPFRFLQKPVSSDELSHVMMDSIEHIRRAGQIFFFQIGHEKYQLHYHAIIYFEGAARKVIIHTARGTYEIYGKIADIIVRLDKSLFCQTHASYIVNMDYIHSIKKTDVILQDDIPIPISKKHQNEIKGAYLSFIERRCGK